MIRVARDSKVNNNHINLDQPVNPLAGMASLHFNMCHNSVN